ncbi:MAG: CoA transferase [Thaumarchaeota archaeon]|nr:CoA transferase [Nitrososphaerota archaeon]
MKGALAGVKVVELGTYVAAPALGSMLGILGAQVVKVEPPEGDPTRKTTPWSWANYNWNKKSVALDLKSRDGSEAIRRLLREADVFVESLSPRAIRELGLGFAYVKKLNSRIIYCSIKGFASDSASSERVGFDTIAQAEGGLMHVAGGWGRPARVGNPCVDLTAANFGAIGILAAMLREPRKAAFVEVPLLDVVVYWNGYWLPYIDVNGKEPTDLGSSHPGFSPYGVFETSDGFVFLGVLTDAIWKKLVAKLGLPDRPEYGEARGRISSREEVNRIVQEKVGALTTKSLLAALGEDVPCARVSSLMDIYGDPELRDRGVLRKVDVGGRRASVALPPFLRTLVPMEDLGGPREVGADNGLAEGLKLVKKRISSRARSPSSVRPNR